MARSDFLTRLREHVLIGDGAYGTMFRERGVGRDSCFERLNLDKPDMVRGLHREYRDAGAEVLETNTFGANRTKLAPFACEDDVAAINRAGVALARAAAGEDAYVAGAVGPLSGRAGYRDINLLTDEEVRELFREQVVALADAGADLLIFESFSDLHQMLLAVEAAKAETGLPVVCQFAFLDKGHTQNGVHVLKALEAVTDAGADVVGANCGRGVQCVVSAAAALAGRSDLPVSAFFNAGLPEYDDGRYFFGAPTPYLIDSAEGMADAGVNLIGGCCGTTPDTVSRLAERLRGRAPAARTRAAAEPTPAVEAEPADDAPYPAGSLLYKLDEAEPADAPKRPMVIVELDPPRGLNYEPVVKRAQQLRDMGVDAITMADNPVATLHMDNLALADIVQKEAGLPVILHLACRDSNLIGLQSRLMAAHVRGVNHVLALTGDPARVGDMPGASSVYDMNSFGLIELIRKFNSGVNNAGISLGGRTNFTVGVAFNPNGRNLKPLVDRLRRKKAAGGHFAMTQPMYDLNRFAEMNVATAEIDIPIFVGVMPLVSERNAEFLHNEVPGISLTDDARKRMKGLSGKAGRREGVQICRELLDEMIGKSRAFYLIPPPRFTALAAEMVAHINDRVPAAAESAR